MSLDKDKTCVSDQPRKYAFIDMLRNWECLRDVRPDCYRNLMLTRLRTRCSTSWVQQMASDKSLSKDQTCLSDQPRKQLYCKIEYLYLLRDPRMETLSKIQKKMTKQINRKGSTVC